MQERIRLRQDINITRAHKTPTCWKGLSTRGDHGSHVPAVCCTLSQGRGMHASHAHWAGRLRLVSWQAAVFPFCDGCCRASTRIGDSVRGCEGLAQTVEFTTVLRVVDEIVKI